MSDAYLSALPLGPLDPLVVWVAAAGLATLLAHAAVIKWTDLALFEQHLAAYGVPHAGLPAATHALPALEALAAVLLLTPARSLGASLAAALLLAYAGVMAWHRIQRHELDCGCGGESLPVTWALVVRNLTLAALCIPAAATPGARAMGLMDFMVIAAALLLGSLIYAALNQILRHRGDGRARTTLWRES